MRSLRPVFAFLSLLVLAACGGTSSTNTTPPPPQNFQLTITVTGTGTVTSSPSGINCPTTCTASFRSGTAVTLTASPGSGFQFGGFGGACSGNSCTITLSSNQSVSAAFSSAQVQLTVSVSGQGTVTSSPSGINCPSTCTAAFNSGTAVTLTATPASGYDFSGFGGACSGSSCQISLSSNQSVSATFGAAPASLTVAISGQGTVTSSPSGINCPSTCSASFPAGTAVTLSASTTAADSSFSGYSGACSGTSCQLTLTNGENANVTATFASSLTGITKVNHIIVMLQENRSFDHYFGHLMDYWKANGYPQANDSDFDGEPPTASNVDPTGAAVAAFNLQSACQENPSPSWNETHVDRNMANPTDSNNAPMDGFVNTASGDAKGVGLYDIQGHRVMGYYTGDQLNYYYYLASNFATSDRWFAPMMSRTHVNRMYLYGGTSQGHAYPLDTGMSAPLSGPTIFERLDNNNISWKIYVHQPATPCSTPQCLEGYSYLHQWQYAQTVLQKSPNNFESTDQLMNDIKNGTLPQVAFIEPAGYVALDEHPTDSDAPGAPNVQNGALYVSGIINALMKSPSWKDSVFIFSYDEPGGFYDHVPPQPAVPPDAINYPTDLLSPNNNPPQSFYDYCRQNGTAYNVDQTPVCGFYVTGFRVPLIVISPFTKKNYLSHTVMDYTAILKFIETRFNLQPLTNRDAAQPDMTEFFDFTGAPWASAPTPPPQVMNAPCAIEALSAVTFSPNTASAGGAETVTLNLSHNAFENVTVQLSASSSGVVPATAQIASGSASTSFTINVPTGITSLTITGSIGGIPVSGTVAVQ